MKVAIYYSNKDIRIEERPIPAISEDEILVKMKASGICGTDVMEWYRAKKGPRVLGHEMTGEIVSAGKQVKTCKEGDRVFVSHHVPCYHCHYCLHGNYSACPHLHGGNYEPGGFSEFVRVPGENVRYGTFVLPSGISFETGTMIEPLGCVIAGQRRAVVDKGHTLVVFGAGVSGLLHIQLAKKKGARVIAVDINEYKLKKAREFGADHCINAASYSPEELKKTNEHRLADVVIVCASARQAADSALSSVDRKGSILFFAVPGPEITLPSERFWRDEISIIFSYGASPEDLEKAIELIDNGAINAKDMITHRIQLSSIGEGFQVASQAGNSLKVVVVPD